MTESIEQETGGEEQSHRSGNIQKSCEDEDVPDVVIPDIDKLVGDPVISCVH